MRSFSTTSGRWYTCVRIDPLLTTFTRPPGIRASQPLIGSLGARQEPRKPIPPGFDDYTWEPRPGPLPRPSKLEHDGQQKVRLSLIHISEPTRLGMISYAVFCLKKKNKRQQSNKNSAL